MHSIIRQPIIKTFHFQPLELSIVLLNLTRGHKRANLKSFFILIGLEWFPLHKSLFTKTSEFLYRDDDDEAQWKEILVGVCPAENDRHVSSYSGFLVPGI